MAGLPFLSEIPKIKIPAKMKIILKILIIPVIILIILLIYTSTKPYKVMLVKCEKEKIDWKSKANGGHGYAGPVFTNAVFSMYLVDEQFVSGKRSFFSKIANHKEEQLKAIGKKLIPYSLQQIQGEYNIREHPYFIDKDNNSWIILLSSGESNWNVMYLYYNQLLEKAEISLVPNRLYIATYDNRDEYATGFYQPSYLTINDGNNYDLNTMKDGIKGLDSGHSYGLSNFCFIGKDKIVKIFHENALVNYESLDGKLIKQIISGDDYQSRFRQFTPFVLSPNQDKVAWLDAYNKQQWLLTWDFKSDKPEKIAVVPDRYDKASVYPSYCRYTLDTLKWNPNPNTGIIAMLASSEILIIDTKKKETINRFNNNASSVMHWSPDGTKLGFMSENQLSIYDMKTKTVKTIDISPNGYNFAWVR